MEAVDWVRAQRALEEEVARVGALLRSVRNPAAPALGAWSLAEVAMHLSQAWIVVPALARSDPAAIPEVVPGVGDIADGGSPPPVNCGTWGRRPCWECVRTPSVISRWWPIGSKPGPPTTWPTATKPRPTRRVHGWCGGVRVPPPAFTCHLLNETIVHGYDMARADGRKWAIERAHAAMVIEASSSPSSRRWGRARWSTSNGRPA